MKTAIATAEFYGTDADGEQVRLTVAVGTPVRLDDAARWQCRFAIADVQKPTSVEGVDSFDALARAVRRVSEQLESLREAGWTLETTGGGS